MTIGIGFLMLALVSFSLMGVVHKLGDRVRANPVWVASLTMALASAMAASLTGAGLTTAPSSVFMIAWPFGLCAAAAVWTFQWAVRHGRIVTSWLLLNLSVAIPTGLSIGLYGERVSPTKGAALALIAVAVVLMWWDRRSETASSSSSQSEERCGSD